MSPVLVTGKTDFISLASASQCHSISPSQGLPNVLLTREFRNFNSKTQKHRRLPRQLGCLVGNTKASPTCFALPWLYVVKPCGHGALQINFCGFVIFFSVPGSGVRRPRPTPRNEYSPPPPKTSKYRLTRPPKPIYCPT